MLLYIYIAPILLHDQVRGQKKFRCPCDNRKAKKKNTHLKLLSCPRVHWPCTGWSILWHRLNWQLHTMTKGQLVC